VTYIGESSPRLVPVKQPVPLVGMLADVLSVELAVYEKV
jgi:hypothetical protein